MRKILYIILATIYLSCSNDVKEDNLALSTIPENKFDLSINGNEISKTIINPSAFFICNEKLMVSFDSKKNNVTSELFTIVLTKNGKIEYVQFVDKTLNFDQKYRTVDFIPSSTFNIDKFEFIENKVLKINFSGKLFQETDNYLQNSETIQINGQFEINEFGNSICNSNNDFIKLNDDIYFSDISIISQGNQQDLNVKYNSNSLNGFNISFKNLNNFLKDMPIGIYNFSPNSNKEKIEFRKYIGIPKSFSTHIYIPNDWILYDSSGSFSIDEKVMINNQMVIKGKINFTAIYNGIIEHTFVNADYELK